MRVLSFGSSARNIIDAVNQLIVGRSNAVGTVTLTAGTTSTLIESPTINAGAVCVLSPRTANAAAALATTHTAVIAGRVTITHANAASTDRTFGFHIVGG